jgi:hypothetical protein
MMKAEYRANSQQTIFDIALQFYGSAEGINFLMQDNPGLINDAGLFDLSAPLKIRKANIDPIVLAIYDGYIPVTDGIEDGYEYVLIDENGDFLIDENGDTPTAF